MKKKTVKAKKKPAVKKQNNAIWKAVLTAALSLFILIGIAYAVANELKAKKEAQAAAEAVKAQETAAVEQAQAEAVQAQAKGIKQKATVAVYYLHSTARCSNCFKIETYSKQAVEKNFAKELASKKLSYKAINFDEGANRHYIQDYKLVTKSLVVTLIKNNKEVKYKVLQEVWNNLNNEAAFHAYVKDEVGQFLKEAN